MIRQWSSKCSGAHSQQNFGTLGRPGGCVPTGRTPHERSRTPTTSAWRSSVSAVDGEGPLPAAELHEARHVDDDLRAVLDDGVVLEQRAGALAPAQVARDAGLVGLDDDAQCSQWLGDLEAQRADREVGRVERREARRVERVLHAVERDRDGRVLHTQVGVAPERTADHERAVARRHRTSSGRRRCGRR